MQTERFKSPETGLLPAVRASSGRMGHGDRVAPGPEKLCHRGNHKQLEAAGQGTGTDGQQIGHRLHTDRRNYKCWFVLITVLLF